MNNPTIDLSHPGPAAIQSTPSATQRSLPAAVWVIGAVMLCVIVALTTALAMQARHEAQAQAPIDPLAALQPTATGFAPGPLDGPREGLQPAVQRVAMQPSSQQRSQSSPTRSETAAPASCASCGVVESVQAVKQQGQGTGVGAVAGGVVGGLLGNQMGKGSGKTAMTVLGAVGGGYAGHTIEKNARSTTSYQMRVRMEDGSLRSFTSANAVAVGARVKVDNGQWRVIG